MDGLSQAVSEDVVLMWDRLVLAMRGDGGLHRKEYDDIAYNSMSYYNIL